LLSKDRYLVVHELLNNVSSNYEALNSRIITDNTDDMTYWQKREPHFKTNKHYLTLKQSRDL